MKWTMKNGEKIEIGEMTTQHILNSIRAIEENRIKIGQVVDLGYTGDGAGDGIMYDYIDKSGIYIEEFKKELKKRGINNESKTE